MNLPTLLETEDLLVINKPSGLVVHGDGKHDEPTVADFVVEHWPSAAGVGEPMEVEHAGERVRVPRPGIVHRIDRDTSGCLVIAKNQETFAFLKEQFQGHTIRKKYLAVVYGWPRDDRGIINQPIGRSPSNIRAWTTRRGARGTLREAVTRYTVVRRFSHAGEKYAIIDLYPETGRTHQLRVHMSHIGHPIVGDPLYAGKRTSGLGIHRTALHAERITFALPGGKRVEIIAPIPEDLQKALDIAASGE